MDLSLLVCIEGWALQAGRSNDKTNSDFRGTDHERDPSPSAPVAINVSQPRSPKLAPGHSARL